MVCIKSETKHKFTYRKDVWGGCHVTENIKLVYILQDSQGGR